MRGIADKRDLPAIDKALRHEYRDLDPRPDLKTWCAERGFDYMRTWHQWRRLTGEVPRSNKEKTAKGEKRARRILEQLERGELSIADFLREDSARSVAALVRMRDSEDVSSEIRARAAVKLAELGGVDAVKHDLEGEKAEEPLADADVRKLYGACRRIMGLQAELPRRVAEALSATDKSAS